MSIWFCTNCFILQTFVITFIFVVVLLFFYCEYKNKQMKESVCFYSIGKEKEQVKETTRRFYFKFTCNLILEKH